MSQAENVPTTSRRSFMGGAAAASVAFPASAGAGVSELEQLHALEAEIYQAWEHLGSVCGILGEAEDALWKWEKQNPKPRGREPTRAELSQYLQQTLGEQGSKASFGAAYEQDGTEHKHALAAWEARHETAKEESRYNRACKLEDLANEPGPQRLKVSDARLGLRQRLSTQTPIRNWLGRWSKTWPGQPLGCRSSDPAQSDSRHRARSPSRLGGFFVWGADKRFFSLMVR